MSIPVGTVVERFRVEACLGRGGAGTVYRVRHVSLGLLRALKVIHLDVEELRAQLLAEGRIQARLSHPCLVKVHDTFEYGGDPALLMELVEGPSLQQVLSSTRLSRVDAERLFLEILDGVQHAHEHGVIHRDLKPANVLLRVADGTSHAKVGDFGIARLIDADRPDGTGQTGWVGTPGYMAPELLRGQRTRDPRLDVYALGVLLYRMLSGHHPFPDADPIRRLEAAEARAWTPLEQHLADLPPRIGRAVAGALEPDPAKRLPSAAALRAVFLGEQAPLAPPPAAPAVDAVSSRPRLSGAWLAAGLGLGLLAALGWGWSASLDAQEARGRLDAAEMSLAANQHHLPMASLALLRASAVLGGEEALSPESVAVLLRQGAAAMVYPTRGAPINGVDLGPGRVVSVDHDGHAEVFERATGRHLRTIETGVYRARWVYLSDDERWLSVEGNETRGGAERTGLAWALEDGRSLIHAPAPPRQLAVDPAGEVFAAYPENHLEILGAWSVAQGRQRWAHRSASPIRQVTASADAVLLGYGGGEYVLLDRSSGEQLATGHGANPQLSPDGRHLFTVRLSGGYTISALPGGEVCAEDHISTEPQVIFAPAGGSALVWDRSGRAWWWSLDVPSLHPLVHAGRVSAAALRDAAGAVLGTREGWVLEARQGQVLHQTHPHAGRVTDLVVTESETLSGALDGRLVLQPAADQLLGLLETRQAPLTARSTWGGPGGLAWQEHDQIGWHDEIGRGVREGAVARLVSVPEGSAAAMHSADGVVLLRRDGGLLASPPDSVLHRTMDLFGLDDGGVVVTSRGVYRLWPDRPVAQQSLPKLISARRDPGGGRLFAAFGSDTTVAVIELASGAWVDTFSLPEQNQPGIATLSEVSDGEIFAGTWSGLVVGWDTQTGAHREIAKLDDAVNLVAASPSLLATGSWDERVRAWDRRSGALRWTVDVPEGARTLLWLPDDRGLLVGTTDGRLRLYSPQGALQSVRAAADSAIDKTWLRQDGSVAVLTAGGAWQRWDPERLSRGYATVASSGALSNLRVCRDSLAVVAVAPFPAPESVWAPPEACAGPPP